MQIETSFEELPTERFWRVEAKNKLGFTLSVHQKVSNKQKQSKTVLKGVPGEGKTQI